MTKPRLNSRFYKRELTALSAAKHQIVKTHLKHSPLFIASDTKRQLHRKSLMRDIHGLRPIVVVDEPTNQL